MHQPIKVLAFLLLPVAAHQAVAQVIVGFDATRGGTYNLENQAGARTAISAALPSATFSFTSSLDSDLLAHATGLVIMSPISNLDPISPLTATEQKSLSDFVQRGGFAVILTDHNDTSPWQATNDSFLAPFGVGTTGRFDSPITLLNPGGNPISNGPFGLVTSLTGIVMGSYTSLPDSFVTLGELSGGQVAAGYFGPDALSTGSGAVLFVADANVFHGSWATQDNYNLLSNFVSFAAVPEPETVSLMLLGSVGTLLLALRRRLRRRG